MQLRLLGYYLGLYKWHVRESESSRDAKHVRRNEVYKAIFEQQIYQLRPPALMEGKELNCA